MNVAFNGLSKSWELFVKGFCTGENLPYWKSIWDDCIQEEMWEEFKGGKKEDEEKENLSLVSNTRKGKGKGSNKHDDGEDSTSRKEKKDLSKIKCFMCHRYGNYASQCLNKKKLNN
jgi:hypothetical protein